MTRRTASRGPFSPLRWGPRLVCVCLRHPAPITALRVGPLPQCARSPRGPRRASPMPSTVHRPRANPSSRAQRRRRVRCRPCPCASPLCSSGTRGRRPGPGMRPLGPVHAAPPAPTDRCMRCGYLSTQTIVACAGSGLSVHMSALPGRSVCCARAVRKVGYFVPTRPAGQGDRSNFCVPMRRTAQIPSQSQNSDHE